MERDFSLTKLDRSQVTDMLIDNGSASAAFALTLLRRGTKQQWATNNPILASGEIGLEIDGLNRYFKIGDGVTHWNDLPFDQARTNAGPVSGDPIVVANNGPNVSITVSACYVSLYSEENGSGPAKTYYLSGGTFPLVDNSQNYLVANYNNGNPVMQVIQDRIIYNDTTVIPLNSMMVSNGYVHLSHWDRYGEALPNKLHHRLVQTQRYARESGCELSVSGTNVRIASGIVWRGARDFTLQDTYSNGSNNSNWYFYSHNATGGWGVTFPASGFDYNNYDSTFTGITPLPSNLTYNINWIYRGIEDHQHGYYVLSNTGYKDLPTAIAVTKVPDVPLTISSHALLVGRIICVKGNPVPVLVESAFDIGFTGAPLNDHNQLSGLQGGNDGIEQYHLTQAKWANLISLYPQFDGIRFNLSPSAVPYQPGLLNWDADSGTLELGMGVSGVRQQIGLESYVFVENKSGVTIPNGAVVYLSGDAGNRPAVRLASASSENQSEKVIGVTTHSILNNDTGYVTTQGVLHELNTNIYSPGDMLWLSPTVPGGMTNIRPNAPLHAVFIGVVLTTGNSDGTIFVRPQNGFETHELHDVLTSNVQNEDILLWNSTVSAYINSDALSGKQAYHGFKDRTQTTMVFDNNTTTFTLSGSNYVVYFDGRKKILNTLSITLSASSEWSANPYGQWFVWLNVNGTLGCSKIPWDLLNVALTPVATVYIQTNGTNLYRGILAEERHGYKRNLVWHNHAHYNYGTSYTSGFTTTPTFNTNNTFSFAGGIISDEDIQNDSSGTQTTARIAYRYNYTVPAVQEMLFEPASGTFVKTNANGSAYYDNNGVLTALGANNQYGVYWIYATNRITTPITSIMGQGVYSSVANAQAAPFPTLPGLSVAEWRLLYRIVIQGSPNSFNIMQVNALYNQSTGPVILAAAPTTIAATNVSLIPSGSVSATNVQNAIQELDFEKASTLHYHKINETTTINVNKYYLSATIPLSAGVVIGDATSGNIIFNLYSASGNAGKSIYFKKVDPSINTITITAAGSETIDGSSSRVITTQWASYAIVSDGANWIII